MILSFMAHPALDKTVVIHGYQIGCTYRTPGVIALAGGKGLNFARALRCLGGDPLVVSPLAGYIGRMVQNLAEDEGLASDPVWVDGETRTCFTVVDPNNGKLTEVYETGPRLSNAEHWRALIVKLQAWLPQAEALAVNGGFLPNSPDTALCEVIAGARDAGKPVWLDTYGPQVRGALSLHPELLKINQHEAAEIVGAAADTPAQAVAATAELQRLGAQGVVITLGGLGAVGRDAQGRPFGWAAPPGGLFPIGSGDSFFGGLACGLVNGQTLGEAVRLGVAAGAANTLQAGAGLFTRQQVDMLLPQVSRLLL